MKKAFITGGSRGIGRGIVRILSDHDYDIAFTYNSHLEEANSLAEEVKAKGKQCFFYQASLEEPNVPEEVTTKAINDLNGIDLLVCNAGRTVHNSLLTVRREDIDFVYNLDYRSHILCSKIAANYMVQNQICGNIVVIASTRGIRAYPEDCLYGSMKAALIRSVESMALEMSKYGIRVNCIAPGATAVRGNFSEEQLKASSFASKIPLKRLGSPDEVGHLVYYLASNEARYITGDTIKIDGGLILPGMPEH